MNSTILTKINKISELGNNPYINTGISLKNTGKIRDFLSFF